MAGSPDDIGAPGADEQPQYPGDASGQINPALSQVVDQQDTPEAQKWTADAANRIQDYVTQRAVVNQVQSADEAFTGNLKQTRDALVGMVQKDPGSMDLALDLGTHTAYGLASQHENLGEDTQNTVAKGLESDFHNAVVHAGVQRLADVDQDSAMAALDKYGHLLPDDEKASLTTYASVQGQMRTLDTAAMQLQATKDASVQGYHNATDYLHGMLDPQTMTFRSPPQFLQTLSADPDVSLPTKLALQAGYHQLQMNGDVQTDPRVVGSLLTRMASGQTPDQGELMSHLGVGLSVNDAAFFNRLIGPQDPQGKAAVGQLADTVNQAKAMINDPRFGAAGDAAFSRFTSWLLPALQHGLNLNDFADKNMVQQFAPTAADYRASAPQVAPNDATLRLVSGNGSGYNPPTWSYLDRNAPQLENAAPRSWGGMGTADRGGRPSVPGTDDREGTGSSAPWEQGGNVKSGTSMGDHNEPGSMTSGEKDL